ncbi:MAG TPA: hypothetical protein VEG32_01680 [Clostridia bacterium]|nr:hypothetical protein [Clostridia bacterium]
MWLWVLFSLGLLHGVGPDHLAAITAYGAAAGRDFRRVIYFAVRFAIGHAAVLAIAGILAKVSTELLPERVTGFFEVSAGAFLMLTGVVALLGLLTGKIKVHSHHHHHDNSVHHHFHLHLFKAREHKPSQHPHMHGAGALALGAFFAIGGARSVLTIAPIAFAETFAQSLLRVGVFCLGIVAAMVLYGWLTQVALTSLERFADGSHNRRIMLASAYVVAVFCIVAGGMVVNGAVHLFA